MKSMAFAISLACWLVATPALAQPGVARCAQFVPASTTPMRVWDSALSFAACVQDASQPSIRDPEDIAPMVAELASKLAPTINFYLVSLRKGPPELALRDVYLIGLAHVALLTRARAAIAVPPDLHTNEAAARAFAAAHATLEQELERFAQTAWLVFAAIDEAASANPDLAVTEVDRRVLVRAHELHLELAAYAIPWRSPRELKRLAGLR